MINIGDLVTADTVSYNPSMVYSLRGDLDKPKVVPIEKAELPPDDEDGATTVCPSDDDRALSDFDDSPWNDEWDASTADWTEDFQIVAAPCTTDVFHKRASLRCDWIPASS